VGLLLSGEHATDEQPALRVSKRIAENLELKDEIEGLRTDFRYSEKILRENLLLHKKDELIILVPDDWAQEGADS